MIGKRKIISVLALLVLLLLACVSCAPAPAKKPVQPTPGSTSYQTPDMRTAPPATPQPPTVPTPGVPATMADNIANEVADMSGVKSANVLVVGKTAFVGCNLDKEMDDKEVESLKNSVANKVKNFDQINECLVSADPDLVEQIKDISEGRSTPDAVGDLYTRLKPQR